MTGPDRYGLGALGASPMTWDRFAASLESAHDAYVVARLVAIAGAELIAADRGCLFVPDERGDWHVLAALGFAHEGLSDYLVVEADSDLPIARAARLREPMLFESNRAFGEAFPLLRDERDREGLEAEAILPLASPATTHAVTIFDWHQPVRFTSHGREELRRLAELGATHLGRVFASSPRFPARS